MGRRRVIPGATDTVAAWQVMPAKYLLGRSGGERLQRHRAVRDAVTPVGRPRNGLELLDSDELTHRHVRLLSRRRDGDHLTAGLVEHDDLGRPHEPARSLLG